MFLPRMQTQTVIEMHAQNFDYGLLSYIRPSSVINQILKNNTKNQPSTYTPSLFVL